jgi:hypothetical protein
MRSRGPRLSVRRAGTDVRPGWTVTVDGDRSAALLVRVWLESDGGQAFRGRLTAVDTTPGPRAGEEATVAVASSTDEIVDAVRAWLDDFLGGGPAPRHDGG